MMEHDLKQRALIRPKCTGLIRQIAELIIQTMQIATKAIN